MRTFMLQLHEVLLHPKVWVGLAGMMAILAAALLRTRMRWVIDGRAARKEILVNLVVGVLVTVTANVIWLTLVILGYIDPTLDLILAVLFASGVVLTNR